MVALTHDNWFEISSHLNIQDKFSVASVCRASRIQPELVLLQEYEDFVQKNEFGAKTMAYLLKATEAFPDLKRIELIFNEVKRCCPAETKLNVFSIPQEMQETAFRQTQLLIQILRDMKLPNLCALPDAEDCEVKDLNLVTEWLVNHEKEISSVNTITLSRIDALPSYIQFITLPSELSLFKNLKEIKIRKIKENQTLTGVPYEIKNHGIYVAIENVSDFKIDSNGVKDWKGIEAWKNYVQKPYRFIAFLDNFFDVVLKLIMDFEELNVITGAIAKIFIVTFFLSIFIILFPVMFCVDIYEEIIKLFTTRNFNYSLEF